jgi:hypothetical protein
MACSPSRPIRRPTRRCGDVSREVR